MLERTITTRTRPLAMVAVLALAALALLIPSVGGAKRPWPPVPEGGASFVHFGEEHLNDDDGMLIFPKVIEQSAFYEPDLVTVSGDKSSDGTVENLKRWRGLMEPYDERGIPYFAGVGNHDRKAAPGIPGGLDPAGSLANYKSIFAERPYPFGDAAAYDAPGFSGEGRPASDPPGASSHYVVEFGPVRWVFLDNSCYGIIMCDLFQSPSFPDAEGNLSQYDFLASEGRKADQAGDQLFVVLHMPTQDDRPGHTQPTPLPHTMGEGTSPDNQLFEQRAVEAGVDGVFAGHIKGMWQYSANGVPYFTDGGAGGEVYVGSAEETGVDYGYWHGYRLISVRDGRTTTDAIPVFRSDGIEIAGPTKVRVGKTATFTAVGQQPTEKGPDVKLELRKPDPSRPNIDNLPDPAFMWDSRRAARLKPVQGANEDPRRNARHQTVTGQFRGRCPGRSVVRIKSGWESTRQVVKVIGKGGKRCRDRGPRPGR